jgi:hypothetical protein
MARVIRIDNKYEKEVAHKECGAVVGYYDTEVQSEKHTDYTGDSDIYYFIVCPNCGKKLHVSKY